MVDERPNDQMPASDAASEGQDNAASEDALRAQLEEMERECTQFRSLAQRTQADFANYRRRVDEEREDLVAQSVSRFATKLLPVMDEFKLAMEHASKQGAEAPWLEGVQFIYKKLKDILESEGVQRINAEGQPFDPWQHEALMYQETDSIKDGHIVTVARDGYKIRNRILRPAQVVVARAREGGQRHGESP